MTQTIRAAAIAPPHAPVEIIELAAPALEPGAALLRTVYSEVCGTDVHLQHGRLQRRALPARARATSRSAASRRCAGRSSTWKAAPSAKATWSRSSTSTRPAAPATSASSRSRRTRCPARKVYGITYGANDGPLGGWAEQIWMKPGVKMIRLPGGSGARDVHRRRLRAGDGAARDRPRRDHASISPSSCSAPGPWGSRSRRWRGCRAPAR